MTEPVTPKVTKKRVNGKSKGNGFELTIAKELSTAFAPLCFKRTQQSGAIVGGRNAYQVKSYSNEMIGAFIGDIFAANEADVQRSEGWKFRFTIECKFYKEQDSFTSLFKKPQVIAWFEQAKVDASKINDKLPLLVFKFNHTPIFVAFETTCEPPPNVSTILSMWYNLFDTDGKIIGKRKIHIALLSELLEDLSWWKIYGAE